MSNIICAEEIFVHNNPDNSIKIWELGGDGKSFVKSQTEIAYKGILVRYLGNNQFLAFCAESHRFMTFVIRDNQMTEHKFIKFEHSPDFYGI